MLMKSFSGPFAVCKANCKYIENNELLSSQPTVLPMLNG